MLLEYEKNMLKEIHSGDCILITSHGINISNVIEISISFYLNKFSLCFLLNCDNLDAFTENKYFCNVSSLDKPHRKNQYLKGGVILASSRIVLSDFLDQTVDVSKISCIIIKDCEKIKENSLEAFILYFFRKHNTHGTIKAFSSNCIPFSSGIGSLEKKTDILRTTNLVLYPRFHESIKKSFTKDIEITEHRIKLPSDLLEMQMILVEMLKEVINPIKKNQDISYEKILMSNSYYVNGEIKNGVILNDVYDLKYLIILLFSCSTLRFYMECMKLCNKQNELGKDSTWINLKSSSLFLRKVEDFFQSNEIFNDRESLIELKNRKRYKSMNIFERDKDTQSEIKLQNKHNRITRTTKLNELINLVKRRNEKNIIIVCSKKLIIDDLKNHEELNVYENVNWYTHSEFVNESSLADLEINKRFKDFHENINNFNEFKDVIKLPENEKVIDCTPKSQNDSKYLVVLYDISLSCIRKCEYLGNIKDIEIETIFYKDSLEEETYLNCIRKEKYFFESLISKRAKLPILLDGDLEPLEDESDEEKEYNIIVDSRELRSELPFFLFKYKNNLHISTIPIGDYLLNENTCIERKNISDLISSINSGRLYSQATMLSYSYPSPYILIEFDGRPCLSDYYSINIDTFKNSLISKLVLFLLNFPNIKIIWSESRLFSTKIFRMLQRKDSIGDIDQNLKIDPVLQEILLSIPGITQFNIKKVVNEFNSIKDIVESSFYRLVKILGDSNGKKVYDFFNSPLIE